MYKANKARVNDKNYCFWVIIYVYVCIIVNQCVDCKNSTIVPLSIMGAQLGHLLKPLGPSQHYRIEGV